MVKGLNSSLQNAANLSKILKGMNCKVNLIPANTIAELNINPPVKHDIYAFRDMLVNSGIYVTLRKERGGDIDAACGQLRLRHASRVF
jgi:23S rRNA (adenine2503-C2)-methyltransferase